MRELVTQQIDAPLLLIRFSDLSGGNKRVYLHELRIIFSKSYNNIIVSFRAVQQSEE